MATAVGAMVGAGAFWVAQISPLVLVSSQEGNGKDGASTVPAVAAAAAADTPGAAGSPHD